MRMVLAFFVLGASGPVLASEDASPGDVLRTIFPLDIEVKLALSGAPVHLRDGAAVYAYGESGYEKVRSGTNGITCLLNRDAFYYGAKQFKPTCWDAVGDSTYIPVMLKVGELLSKNWTPEAIRSAIDAGFSQGQFRAPTTGGVAYMLAGDIELDLMTGKVLHQTFPGHYMFYAIGATTSQLGVTRAALAENPTLPTVFTGGAGGTQGLSYIIVTPSGSSDVPHQHY